MKRFKPLELQATNPQEVFDTYKREISKKIIEAVDYGVTNKKKKVTFVKLLLNDIAIIALSVHHTEYYDVIDTNIANLIDYEEYETCALGIKLKQKLTNKVDEANVVAAT